MTTTSRRLVARKRHLCESCPEYRAIEPGEAYLRHTAFPGDDAGYATYAGHPVSMPECASCAIGNGRGDLLAVSA